MAFSEKVKNIVKEKSFFRCVICHQAFVEVHHIIPQNEHGDDTEDNAVALCAGCHDLYGGNPEKRKQIRQMRDQWYREMTLRRNSDRILERIEILPSMERIKVKNGIAIYHFVFKNEDFEETAKTLFDLVKSAQEKRPDAPRHLYLYIEGHKNENGGYDHDMWELQSKFMTDFLLQFLTEANLPLGRLVNKVQINDIPDELRIFN